MWGRDSGVCPQPQRGAPLSPPLPPGSGPCGDLGEATMSQAITCLKGGGGESPPPPPPSPGSLLVFPPEPLFRQVSGVTYRIPALLYIPPAATFLAFSEKRSSTRDEDTKYLVLRRGHRHGSSVTWGPVEELSALVLPGRRTMNPCPLYDARSGTIFLFCICVEWGKTERCQIWRGCSAARLCFATSTDGGCGWTPLRDVTDEAIGADLAHWATFAVGPGHGVQLGSGRLVVPAYTYYVHRCLCGLVPLPCYTRQHALIFYSDDGGRSWHKGALVGGAQTGECQVAEISGSDAHQPLLYCNARALRGCRAVAFSTDRGLQFERPVRCKALGEPPRGCQGSVVSFAAPASTGDAPTWLLYSHPTDRHRRRNLGIYLNPAPLDGAGWWHPWVLHPGPAGYSDLAVCPGGMFGCLFECGTTSACEEITFCLFALETSDCHEQNLKTP
ncbi:sialidase-3 isoform X2 [Falco rusticolus]|uniref:sialidase-3 isoform X2 n=2 Tax=Falco rusticolus TaxID=120794 RepID=UPI0018867AA2|nr:sialidase-3 isoform X2 [Falco rusticolus]